MNDAIEKCLKTWYPKDHPLHLDPLHPAIKLAGEAGEILDLYGKDQYKPGFSMWQCKNCFDSECRCDQETLFYTPLILDELGDWWYYWRILAYQFEVSTRDYPNVKHVDTLLEELLRLNLSSAKTALIIEANGNIELVRFLEAYVRLNNILHYLDTSFDELTELNYIKLNSDPTNHGWKGA